MKEIQERYKNDPQRLQQEMFKLYKEHGVNPLGGCWPMLLPMPVLFALFFVFQNTIELRGHVVPLAPGPLPAGSAVHHPDPHGALDVRADQGRARSGWSRIPQMKMMLYMMPVMMTVLFLNFASGLNLYYTVSNIASIPQQWMLARERKKRAARAIVDVKTERPPEPQACAGQASGERKAVTPQPVLPLPACSPIPSPRSPPRRAARRSPWSG